MAKVKDMSQHIQCAADSIDQLRLADVYRVLVESNDDKYRSDIATYIKHHRPDLVEEVDSVMSEVS